MWIQGQVAADASSPGAEPAGSTEPARLAFSPHLTSWDIHESKVTTLTKQRLQLLRLIGLARMIGLAANE